jgi:hypothetical protein
MHIRFGSVFLVYFIFVKISLASCVHFSGAEKPKCAQNKSESGLSLGQKHSVFDPIGIYNFYRFINKGEGQRKCRLHPTCSHFALQSFNNFGILKGFVVALARPQMEHSDQGGLLKKSIASDDRYIFNDPVANWKH